MLDPVYYAVSAVMWFWHEVFGLVLDPASGAAWALSVVFLVLTLRALLIKPFLAQLRSAQAVRALAPQTAALRERYGADEVRLAREVQALQSAHGVSPLGGCLPVLLQFPVFIGLLHVLHGFNRPGLTFEQNSALPNYVFGPPEVRSFLEARLFGTPLSAYLSQPQELLDSFGAHVDRWEVAVVAVPLMLVAAVATHLTARHSAARQPAEGPAAQIVRWLPWVLPLGVLVGGALFPFPIAILLYWLTNNAWTLVQQHLVFRRLDAQPVVAGPAPVAPPEPQGAPSPPPSAPHPSAPPPSVPRRRRRHSSGHRPRRHR